MDGACELIAARDVDAPVLITCEHASQRLPAPWQWPEADGWLEHTHWAYDIGAAEVVRELCGVVGAGAVLADFSRLLIDPNRPLESPTLVRRHAEGRDITLNARVDAAERAARVAYWQEYHRAVDHVARTSRADVILAIHSFTPVYEGARRDLDVGVLFDREQDLAECLAAALAPLGVVRLNEPYSGKKGLIYSAQRHADACDKRAVEIEVRQDRLLDVSFRQRLVAALAALSWCD